MSAAFTVDSSDVTVSSSALWRRFSPPSNFVNGHVSPQSQEGDWVRPHLCKLSRHGPWPVQKLETMHDEGDRNLAVGYSRVGNNSVVDHRSRRLVLSFLRNCVDKCHGWPYWALRCNLRMWMLKDISIHRPIWMGFDDLKHVVSCRFTM